MVSVTSSKHLKLSSSAVLLFKIYKFLMPECIVGCIFVGDKKGPASKRHLGNTRVSIVVLTSAVRGN